MPSVTIYSNSAGYQESDHATYATARSGTVIVTNQDGVTGYFIAGQATGYAVFQSYVSFDTSVIPDDAVISSVELSIYAYGDTSTTDFTIQARLRDWGATLTSADWVAGANQSSDTLLATYTTSSGWTSTNRYIFTNNGTNLVDNINKTGYTRFYFTSDRTVAGTTPTNDEYVAFAGNATVAGTDSDPKLVIVYQNLQSISGSITMSGTVTKRVSKTISGSTGTLSGSMLTGIAYLKSLSGTMGNLSGTLVNRTNKALSGSITGSGTVSKHITKSFIGSMGVLTGALNATKTKLVSISGAMGALTGAVTTRQTGFGVALSGSISSISGTISRRTNKALSGVITPTGRVTLLGTFRSVIMKAGTVIRRTIQGGSG